MCALGWVNDFVLNAQVHNSLQSIITLAADTNRSRGNEYAIGKSFSSLADAEKFAELSDWEQWQ